MDRAVAYVDRALGSEAVESARRGVGAAIDACPETPLADARDAAERRAAWERLSQAIEVVEGAVAPFKARVNNIRLALSRHVAAIVEPAEARRDSVRRLLGAWEAEARVRRQAEAANAERAAQDGAPGSLLDLPREEAQPIDAPPMRHVWVVEVHDATAALAVILRLQVGHPDGMLRQAVQLNVSALRKLLANERGAELVKRAGLEGLVAVRQEARAVRRRPKTSLVETS